MLIRIVVIFILSLSISFASNLEECKWDNEEGENIAWVNITNPLAGPKIYNRAVMQYSKLNKKDITKRIGIKK